MRAEQEETNGNTKEELLCWRILVPVVNLLPHIEVVVRSSVELEWNTPHPVKHDEGA